MGVGHLYGKTFVLRAQLQCQFTAAGGQIAERLWHRTLPPFLQTCRDIAIFWGCSQVRAVSQMQFFLPKSNSACCFLTLFFLVSIKFSLCYFLASTPSPNARNYKAWKFPDPENATIHTQSFGNGLSFLCEEAKIRQKLETGSQSSVKNKSSFLVEKATILY